MSDLTEEFLIKAGGYAIFQQARMLVAAGKVSGARWEPPLLRGKVAEGRRVLVAGLKIKGPRDVEVLCSCEEARRQGKICVHAVAVGLAALVPASAPPAEEASMSEAPPRGRSDGAERDSREPTDEIPGVVLSVEGSLRHLELRAIFSYGRSGVLNAERERSVVGELEEAGFEGGGAGGEWRGVLRGEEAVLQWFAGVLPQWEKKWRVRRGERFAHVTRDLMPLTPVFRLDAAPDAGDWLDFRLHFQAGADAVLGYDEVRRLLTGGRASVDLRNGKRAVVSRAMVEEIGEVLRDVDPQREAGISGWRVPARQAGYLRSTFEEPELADACEIALPVLPGGVSLRPYQEAGYRWLSDLAGRGLGGLLADDMGLGKTLQALAMLAGRRGPHLVVCPASLVWNWSREARRFFPEMRVVSFVGANRGALLGEIAGSDVVITSYGILRRDQETLAGMEWDCVLLDEAQHIKNPGSQNAKAATSLRARARFVLTGTPLENSLRDLWSLYRFVLSGYLGTAAEFRERYEAPMQSASASERRVVARRLRRRLAPYFLRREKRGVLPELPPRIEQVLEVDLTPRQKRLYDQIQASARGELDALLESGGNASARIRILAALLRLRQICCDTRLLGDAGGDSAGVSGEDIFPTSGKLGALFELLGEATDAGHRVLVFSQFTTLLDLVGPVLEEREIGFLRLDGTTRDRASVVEAFQAPEGPPVLLLSLKAGGTGLNLTAADTVIHLDPWWNPAVEAQATDRAHRLGQDRVVTSIKLIARDTVEHKVLRMQEEKKDLFQAAMDADESWRSLSISDMAGLLES